MKTFLLLLLLSPVVNAAETRLTGNELSTTTTLGVIRSSSTSDAWLSGSTSGTSFVACIATVSFVTAGGSPLLVTVSMAGNTNARYGAGFLNFLQNGQWVSPLSSSVGFVAGNSASVSDQLVHNLSGHWLIPASQAPAAGLNSWCLQIKTNTGTLSYGTSAAIYNTGASANTRPQFSVIEMR